MLQMLGAQKLRSEAHSKVRRNDEVEAQQRRWTFYETIKAHAPIVLQRKKKMQGNFDASGTRRKMRKRRIDFFLASRLLYSDPKDSSSIFPKI
jgi:transcriptional regulator NrdR family protein